MRILSVVLALVLGVSSASADTFMNRTLRITDGRADRTAAAPLVIAMHGFLGTARSMNRKTQFDSLARANGFVVAYPEGKRRRWNDGRSPENQVDDVAYLASLIANLVAGGSVDPERIFLAGHSNGGGMAMRMACDRPDLIAGIAVAATKTPSAFQCASGRPVPAIFFHGTLDPVAPSDGRPNDDRLGGTLSAADTLALWSNRNRCKGVGQTQTIDRREDSTSAEIIQYSGCRAPLTYVLIEGHGHAWPGAGPRLQRLQGPATQEVDAAVLSWWFFSKL